jgi:hypothetical protein
MMTVDTYTIDGAHVTASTFCRDDGTQTVIYELTATDTRERRYALGYDPAELHTATGGLMAVEGSELHWLRHRVNDVARVSISGGPCDVPVPRLAPIYRTYMPTIIMD